MGKIRIAAGLPALVFANGRAQASAAGVAVALIVGATLGVVAANAAAAPQLAVAATPVYVPYPEDPPGTADVAEIAIAVGQMWRDDWADLMFVGAVTSDTADLSVLEISYDSSDGIVPAISEFDDLADLFGVEFILDEKSRL